MNQQTLIESLPPHLSQYVEVQDYAAYTPRDQAVWRFLLHRLMDQLADTAHPVYLEGLRRTGISPEYIPVLDEMNACLEDIGWHVLGVDGFIPPAVFMAFQARRILVVATRMRTVEQILYTPAPDIVHESAGHAPFLVDVDYAEFLQRFGEIGMQVLSSREDQAVFAAIRQLSILKESGTTDNTRLHAAEARLQQALASNQVPSEATLLARLHWWTVEYGLVGGLADYRLYGAGLLSSLGESQHCLDDNKVVKRLLTVDAIRETYDITREQPCLFVAHSCRHLSQVLEDMARGLAQTTGGLAGINKAIDCATVVTLEFNSGVQVSGQVSEVLADAMGNVTYVHTTGPSQLSFAGQQLPDHGTDVHAAGFGSPVGYVTGFKRCLSEYSIDELRFVGIEVGQQVNLEFVSGVQLQGRLLQIIRRQQKNVLLSFADCQVSTATGDLLFEPEWGQFDMAVGIAVSRVAGGPADPEAFPQTEPLPAQLPAVVESTPEAAELMTCYARVQQARETQTTAELVSAGLVMHILREHGSEWLLLYETYELLLAAAEPMAAKVLAALQHQPQLDPCLVQVLGTAIHHLETNHEST